MKNFSSFFTSTKHTLNFKFSPLNYLLLLPHHHQPPPSLELWVKGEWWRWREQSLKMGMGAEVGSCDAREMRRRRSCMVLEVYIYRVFWGVVPGLGRQRTKEDQDAQGGGKVTVAVEITFLGVDRWPGTFWC